MSGLDTLSPDQRAVLQLILAQGRGYAELATTLELDPGAVRERAHAAAVALAGGQDEVDAAIRGRVVDYLLGQQDDGERIVTFAELGDAPDACRWAHTLRERLGGVAREELPRLPTTAAPAVASANGRPAHANATTVAAPAPAATATAPAPAAAAVPAPMPTAAAPAGGAVPPQSPSADAAAGPSGPRPSRLGGAILIAGAAALAIVLAIVLIDNGGGKSPTGTTQAQTSAQTQTATTPSTTATGASRAPAARPVAAAVLRSPIGGSALGAGIVQQSSDGSRLLAVEAGRLAANGANDYYAIWLQGAAGSRFMGFVPSKVGSDGTFTVSATLARDLSLSAYPTLLVTRETTTSGTAPTTPGTVVLSGQIRSTG